MGSPVVMGRRSWSLKELQKRGRTHLDRTLPTLSMLSGGGRGGGRRLEKLRRFLVTWLGLLEGWGP